MKKILVLYFSQSGQLKEVVNSVIGPLQQASEIELIIKELQPQSPFPFPWPFMQFFNTFPETVYEDAEPLQPLEMEKSEDFDLIILTYQVWFLSPSLPTTAFLQSDDAHRLLNGKPVITLIGCRNMWLTAQEKVKYQLKRLNAHLIDNVVLIDNAHSAATFISTPLWVLTGNRGPFLAGLIPPAGIAKGDIQTASRFGKAIAAELPKREKDDFSPMLEGLQAVTINEHLIASEKIAHRSFRIWGKLLRSIGRPSSRARQVALAFYIVFLIALIVTVVPITAILKILLRPLTKQHSRRQRNYYAAPSGESTHRMEQFL